MAVVRSRRRSAKAAVLVTLFVVLLTATLGCEGRDAKCRDAYRTVNSLAADVSDVQEQIGASEYFSKNCTWSDGEPVAK